MTDDISDKVRALFLTALMVFSVFAGTVAFAGTAAAANASSLEKATHYEDNEDGVIIELAFDGDVSLDANEQVTVISGTGSETTFNSSDISQGSDGNPARVIVDTGGTVIRDIAEVTTDNFTAPDGTDLDETEFTARFAPTVAEEDTTSATGFTGADIAFEADSAGTAIDVFKEDDISRGVNTGTGSQVFVVDTDEFDTGELNFTNRDTDNVTSVELDELGLSVTADDVTDEDNLTAGVSADEFGRAVTVELLDGDDEVVNTVSTTLDNEGEATVDLGQQDAANYSVVVTDDNTQVDATDDVTVTQAATGQANFGQQTFNEQRGDVVDVTVELSATSVATVEFGSDAVNYNATVTVEESDDDGDTVTLELNTVTGEITVAGDDSVVAGDDGVDVRYNTGSNSLSSVLEAGSYDLQVVPGETTPSNVTGDTVNRIRISSFGLDEPDVTQFRTHTIRSGLSVGPGTDIETADDVVAGLEDGTVTPTSSVASGDQLVHQLGAEGLEGFVTDASGSTTTAQFFNALGNSTLTLTITQDDKPINQPRKQIVLGPSNTTVVAGEDQYFLVTQTGALSDVSPDDGSYTAELALDPNDNSDFFPDATVDTSFSVAETGITVTQENATAGENATIAGSTTLAPGTEVRVTLSSADDVEPGFRRSGTAIVTQDRQFSTSFDLANNSAGDGYTVEVRTTQGVSGVSTSVEGTLQNATDEPTPTPTDEPTPTPTEDTGETTEPTDEQTETTTGTPGFTAVLGIVALLGAALLALRRRD